MYRKTLSSFLMLFSFLVIAIGGYQCATEVTQDDRGEIPIISKDGGSGEQETDDNVAIRASLPTEKSVDPCARPQYSKTLRKQYGAIGSVQLDTDSLGDYRLGAKSNFEIRCPRLFLKMKKVSNTSEKYKGKLTITYEASNSIKRQTYSSGQSEADNKYNTWFGNTATDWVADNSMQIDNYFSAIFEDNHAAIILKIVDVREKDINDGTTSLFGSGYIYYKMFRIYSGDIKDVCYSKGVYVSQAHTKPPKPSKRCWFLGLGPFSCRPEGVLGIRQAVTNIDITKTANLNCYQQLGIFGNLDLREAFNVANNENP